MNRYGRDWWSWREKQRFGYRRHTLPRRRGEGVNPERLHRVYCEAGLSLRRKKRKHCMREGKPLLARTSANREWALDFVHDAVSCGRTIRVLCLHAGMLGIGRGHELRKPEGNASIGWDCGRARAALSDSLRQRIRAHQSAFPGLVCRATDRVSAYSAGKADDRTRMSKASTRACGKNV
jgi:hypothetical protein